MPGDRMKCGDRALQRRAVVAICALTVVGMSGVPAHARSEAVIWEGNDEAVVLAPQDEETAPPNDHPVTIAPQDIETMLASLSFRYTDQETDTEPVAVFNKEQVEILGEALATGLSRATPSQDVTFSLVGSHRLSPGAFARRNRLTAGRAFFRDGKLNVIFGEIQSPYRKKNIYGRLEEDFSPRQYGSRDSPDAQGSMLLASSGASLHAEPHGQRDDWVVFDPSIANGDPANADPKSGPPPAEAPPAPSPTRPPLATSSEDETSDLEQRLKTLKGLREKDLISEEVYREKVDEILEEL